MFIKKMMLPIAVCILPLFFSSYITAITVQKIISGKAQTQLPQPIYKNGYFFNRDNHEYGNRFAHFYDTPGILAGTISSYCSQNFAKIFSSGKNNSSIEWIHKETPFKNSKIPCVQWIGHASFLIQIGSFNILTDPIFGAMKLYKRHKAPGITIDELPPIDCVVISHNHLDHMDEPSLLALKKHNPIMLVPTGNKSWFVKRGFTKVYEATWWDSFELRDIKRNVSCTFVPAVHWSTRKVFDAHKSLWGGWVFSDNKTNIYFAGDTAYKKEYFTKIKNTCGPIDCALLPIAPCEPHKYTKSSHINASEALQAFYDLEARYFVPMHWGTFRLGPDTFDGPIKRLQKAWKNKVGSTSDKKLCKLAFGQQLKLSTS